MAIHKNHDDDEHDVPARRGPGRPPKVRDSDEEAPAKASKDGVMVTYKPLDRGDPVETMWNGHKFEANVPHEVNAALHKEMIESAKGNPWFQVEGHPRAKRVNPYGVAEPVPPPGQDVDPVALDDSKMVEEP